MNGFSNANIKTKLNDGYNTAFAPAVSFALVGTTLTVTDASVFEAGAARKEVLLTARDKNGKKVLANIAAADVDDAVAMNLAALDFSGGITLEVTVVSDKGRIADGRFDGIGIVANAGNVASWDEDNNALK